MTENALPELIKDIQAFHDDAIAKPPKRPFREMLHKSQELGLRCSDWMLENQKISPELDHAMALLKAGQEALAASRPE